MDLYRQSLLDTLEFCSLVMFCYPVDSVEVTKAKKIKEDTLKRLYDYDLVRQNVVLT